jgi:hypothetical protein
MTQKRRIACTWRLLLFLGILSSQQLAFGLPDLAINRRLLKTSVEVRKLRYTQASCDYQEGCLRGTGVRKLLKVDVGIANIGPDDLRLGDPLNPAPGYEDLFVYSPCHDHYHMKTMVAYRLLTFNYTPVCRGRKQAFCLRDNYPYTSWAGTSSGYHCGFQGITAGWQDVYDKSLDCQYVDITGVPSGNYLLEVTVNPARAIREQNYANNKVVVMVTVP